MLKFESIDYYHDLNYIIIHTNLWGDYWYSGTILLGSVHILRHPILALFRPPPPPPSVIHRHLWQTPPLDDVIFSHPPSPP